jgi:hypothetical protein
MDPPAAEHRGILSIKSFPDPIPIVLFPTPRFLGSDFLMFPTPRGQDQEVVNDLKRISGK